MDFSNATTWRLHKKEAGRFLAGHPWVFANELTHKPQLSRPGDLVVLCNHEGTPVAHGYGNPGSLIVFRSLARIGEKPWERLAPAELIGRRLLHAWTARRTFLGHGEQSFRLCFAEADGLPGLVVDHYYLKENKERVFVAQILTAGMQHLLGGGEAQRIFSELVSAAEKAKLVVDGSRWSLITRFDSSIRKFENLELLDSEITGSLAAEDLQSPIIAIASSSALDSEPVGFNANLVNGQKTGFFLDQSFNLKIACSLLGESAPEPKILDLFCHAGQWSVQLGRHLRKLGSAPFVTAVDSSAEALDAAGRNLGLANLNFETRKLDIVAAGSDIPRESYDVVVCDPPALIKNRKDIPQGRHAYKKVNEFGMCAAKKGGLYISCSCSHHLSEEDFAEVLLAAQRRSGRSVQWLARGQQGPDHPMLLSFPEGRYLKCWIGRVE